MKLYTDQPANLNIVTGYGDDHVLINKQRHDGNLLVTPDEIRPGWAPGGFAGLTADDFAAVRELQVQVVIIGTGARQRFPAPALLRPLIEAGIGFEVMDLPAACRTYNILAGEGRKVVAALLFDPAS
ncbi:Mth938-like domain-containing protein [Thauera sp. CAU 1555]|uniref:Mth938-like domain-containing protein n=1 Tax=Thauera sedimentorum TaxID=2767595 RepID=A0ABR9B9D3_9RHOO|nr:Mth938-like domain-containing protein [Thauera sedimentorum]MBC9072032.1 Mth938-like domain-containing protein [Thauera sedimentorum]MBD8502951.1 Mth938-like domain-containing protein [Thauera sedimentorum]